MRSSVRAKVFNVPVESLLELSAGSQELDIPDPELYEQFQKIAELNEEDRFALKRIIQAVLVKNQIHSLTPNGLNAMTKQELIKKIQDLPEDTPLDHLAAEVEKIRFRLRIDRGRRQTERGESVPHEEIENMIVGWLEE